MSLWKKVRSLFTGETLDEKFEKILIEEEKATVTPVVPEKKTPVRKRANKIKK